MAMMGRGGCGEMPPGWEKLLVQGNAAVEWCSGMVLVIVEQVELCGEEFCILAIGGLGPNGVGAGKRDGDDGKSGKMAMTSLTLVPYCLIPFCINKKRQFIKIRLV